MGQHNRYCDCSMGWSARSSRSRRDKKLSLPGTVQTGSGAHPASYSMGTVVLSRVVKRSGREIDHAPASSAQVKNGWSYTSRLPTRLHVVGKDHFYFPLQTYAKKHFIPLYITAVYVWFKPRLLPSIARTHEVNMQHAVFW